ncbi:RNA-guided endonuclease InsQ/TnpB family protein [Vibrio harveyi]|uniref:RNA-guided endonuclease InsQ/TnpB family protein n=1 Tax=Vibrio harveyi TaxID=669 RepID=UPI003CF7C6A0
MKIQRGFKFRLKSTRDLEAMFWRQAGACRFVWNLFLKRQEYRRSRGHYVESFQTMCLHLTQVKKHYTFLKEVDSTTLQQTLKDLHRAYMDAFDPKQPNKRMPVKKKRATCRNSFRYTQRVTLQGNTVYLPKLGTFRFHQSRKIIGKLKNTTVGFEGGHWHVSFQTEYEQPDFDHPSQSMVGVDVGVARFATLSNGSFIPAVDAFKKHSERLAKLQRRLAKKKRFSANWKKLKARISKLHTKVARIRYDLSHKVSTYLSKSHAVIVFEDLSIKNMTKSAKGTMDTHGSMVKQKSGLNRSILDQGWGKLISFCEYKQKWANGMVIKVNPRGTSQRCHVCGHQHKDNRQSQSLFECQKCGLKIHADDNASINIEAAGHAVLACGEKALAYSVKQEPTDFARSQPLLFN